MGQTGSSPFLELRIELFQTSNRIRCVSLPCPPCPYRLLPRDSSVNPKRPKVEPIRQPTLFQMEKLEETEELAGELKIERPYALPGILFGTSSFTANGWQGSFYPPA